MSEPLKPRSRIKEIYLQAKDLASAEERDSYLDTACGSDTALRRRIETLLEADQAADGFLSYNAIGDELELGAEKPGTAIGHYRLVERIGEGGFGVVWRAEQTEPVKRQVALKIVKLGMDTKEVIARFEAERQALALMDHPNIAKVYDAGATESGRPYFAMELVDGQSITDYCDERRAPVPERIELFLRVCEAVQHAHAQGIVHRDLKPSNVVVTEADGKPRVKVIDFGIAKSMQGRLTDKTLVTRREVLLGTPVYMSPEQLNLDTDTVDARSDIYSLGVLLYELIAGTPPFQTDTLRRAAFAEVQRILREVKPPKPSTRLQHLGANATDIAERRALEPLSLQRILRRDLDWVVMRALEKDPGRRYATTAELAQDLQRHLRNQPVLAGPPSVVYLARKFVQRNRATLAWSTGMAAVLIISGLLGIRWAEERAGRVKTEARRDSSTTGYRATNFEPADLVKDIVSVEEDAQLSPDETMLAYVDWSGRDADIWVRDLKTGERRNLTQSEKRNPGIYEMCMDDPVWSPDSRRLAYTWADDRGTTSLRVVAVDNLLPSLSVSGSNRTYSVQVDLDASRLEVLRTATTKTCFYPKAWTADGRHLLCRRIHPEGLAMVSVDTGSVRVVSPDEGCEHPRMSPDGQHAAYSRSNPIHLVEIVTGRQTQLTIEGNCAKPIWSPDGSVLLFSSDRQGTWDLYGVRLEGALLKSLPFAVRLGVGNHNKRLTRSGKLIVHRKITPGEGYTVAGEAAPGVHSESAPPGIVYFRLEDQLHTMAPDGTQRRMLPANVGGEPSHALHASHRWFLQLRTIPGEYPSGKERRELFALRGDGDEPFAVQLTDNPEREPLVPRWARDRETGVADGVISWMVRLWADASSEPPRALYAAQVTFDESGNLVASGSPTLLIELTASLSPTPGDPGTQFLTNSLDPGHGWSPIGDQVVYCKDHELYILKLETGETTMLTPGENPRWSPDGTRIAFNYRDGVYTTPADHAAVRPLFEIPRFAEVELSPPGEIGNACWSPDSSQLLYVYWKPGTVKDINIFRIPAEGGEPVNLTSDIRPDWSVAWCSSERLLTQPKEIKQ